MNETSRVHPHLSRVSASRPFNWEDFGDLEDFDEPSSDQGDREGDDTIIVRVPSLGRGAPFLDEGRPAGPRDSFGERETPRSRAPAALSWKPFSALRL